MDIPSHYTPEYIGEHCIPQLKLVQRAHELACERIAGMTELNPCMLDFTVTGSHTLLQSLTVSTLRELNQTERLFNVYESPSRQSTCFVQATPSGTITFKVHMLGRSGKHSITPAKFSQAMASGTLDFGPEHQLQVPVIVGWIPNAHHVSIPGVGKVIVTKDLRSIHFERNIASFFDGGGLNFNEDGPLVPDAGPIAPVIVHRTLAKGDESTRKTG